MKNLQHSRRIKAIMLAPKPSTFLFTIMTGIVIGLIVTMFAGLIWTAPQPRSYFGLLIASVVIIYGTRQITAKNRRRMKALSEVLCSPSPTVTRITTNPAKPKKTFRLSAVNRHVDIPEKRWKKLAPLLKA